MNDILNETDLPSFLFTGGQDRVMVIAPHPDDESLATGGLLTRAARSGVQVRVVFVTDGENNPWPQRVLERRFRIGREDRRRWGFLRRREALAALSRLGLGEECAQFLNLPDQGGSEGLLQARIRDREAVKRAILSWRPTLLVIPSIQDVHPDHNALSVMIHLALESVRSELRPEILHYLVHKRGYLSAHELNFPLSADERKTKLSAILCHGSQMVLSRKRFTSYARSGECFFTGELDDPTHPIRGMTWSHGALRIRLQPRKLPFMRGELWVAAESPVEGSLRWRVPLTSSSGLAPIRWETDGQVRRYATIRPDADGLEVRLPSTFFSEAKRAFVKFNRRLSFYDEAGWREAPPFPQSSTLCHDLPRSAISLSSCSFASSYSGGGLDSSG
jgi:LmbE family N-acetylglucosaminyl deacetylase